MNDFELIQSLIQEKAEADAEIAGRYNNIKAEIYLDIAKEFRDDLAALGFEVKDTKDGFSWSLNK